MPAIRALFVLAPINPRATLPTYKYTLLFRLSNFKKIHKKNLSGGNWKDYKEIL